MGGIAEAVEERMWIEGSGGFWEGKETGLSTGHFPYDDVMMAGRATQRIQYVVVTRPHGFVL